MDPRDRRTSVTYDDALAQRATDVAIKDGTSGYFTQPLPDLDPNLFDGQTLKPAVRRKTLATLYDYWASRSIEGGTSWSTVWLAGSGITGQWAAARNPGDLDVLIGVDSRLFRQANPRFAALSEADIAGWLNDDMKANLWPVTATTKFGAGVYEQTFYVNPGSKDIRDINPYAAYDVTHGHWTVHPVALPADWDPDTYFPDSYRSAIEGEHSRAVELIEQYGRAHGEYQSATNAGQRRNAETHLHAAVHAAADLFHSIHTDRQLAFAPSGAGYKDFYNYRWQAHKRSGVVPALHTLADLDSQAHQADQQSNYGEILMGASSLLRRVG